MHTKKVWFGFPMVWFCLGIAILLPLASFGQSSPSITTQPQSQSKLLGTNATFTVVASGQTPLDYQWTFNGTNLSNSTHISGATNAILTVSNIVTSDAGSYRVIVSNRHGTVTSSIATLTVLVPAKITVQPASQSVIVSNNVSFSATAIGTGSLSYNWYFNGVPLSDGANVSGAATGTLSLTNVQTNQAGSYQLVVTNNYGSDSSSLATLTVRVPPSITVQPPLFPTPFISNSISLGVEVAGDAPLVSQWYFNNVAMTDGGRISGSATTTLTITNLQKSDSGSYFIVVTNSSGSVTSAVANMNVLVPAMIVQQPQGQSVVAGSDVLFSISAIGDPPLTYRWLKNHSPLDEGGQFSGVFTPNLTIHNAQLADAGTYAAEVFGVGGDVSADATLTVLVPPSFTTQPQSQTVAIGTDINVSGAATGTLPISYQWLLNGTPLADDSRITGSTTGSLTIANAQYADSGSYSLVASNVAGTATSSTATVSVLTPPSITQQPAGLTVGAGTNVTFSAIASGDALNYQWFFNGTALTDTNRITGSTANVLAISGAQSADAGSYVVVVTNLVGSVTSSAAALTVLFPPAIPFAVLSRSVPPGLPTTFTAQTVSGSTPLAMQWQFNGTNIPGATAQSYTLPAANATNLGVYALVASNQVGVTTSSGATLTFGSVAAWGRNSSSESLPPPDLTNAFALAGMSGASYAARTDGTVVGWGTGAGVIPASATNVVAISGCGGTVVLRADGTMVGWAFGSTAPIAVPTASNIVAVAAGYNFGYGLRAEGTLVSWGSPPTKNVPTDLNHVTAIACGTSHAVALRSDGSLVSWGTDSPGVTNVPAGLTNVVSIAAGYNHSLALKADGTVAGWGGRWGTNLPPGLTNIASIASGSYPQGQSVDIAVRSNGTIVVWGDNGFGETNPPPALTNLVSVSGAGAPYHGMTIIGDGKPLIVHPPVGLTAFLGRDVTLHGDAVGTAPLSYQWMFNGTNIPGATKTSLSISRIQSTNAGNYQLVVSNALGVATSLAAPLVVMDNQALSFLVQAGGRGGGIDITNYQGGKQLLGVSVLGNGPVSYQWYFSPSNFFTYAPFPTYTPIPSATNDSLLLDPALVTQSGSFYLTASNGVTALNNMIPVNVRILFSRAWGFQAVSNSPITLTNVVAIATGNQNNYFGSYFAVTADGKVSSWANYSPSYGETNLYVLSNSVVVAVSASYQHTLALRSDGTVYACGANFYGQTNVPAGLKDVVAIACGDSHDLALKSDGTVIAWGQNLYGEGTNSTAATNGAVAIAAGQYHNLGLRADGTVFGWGQNIYQQTTIPAAATNVIAIAAGQNHGLALRADGKVIQWGTSMANYPVPTNLSNVVAISASGMHSTAVRYDGSVVSWGYEYTGYASNNVPGDLANVISVVSSSDHDFALLGTRAPAFTIQPYSRNVYKGATNVLIVGKVSGVQPMTYQWRFNGTNIPGATIDTLTLTNAQFSQSGAYQLLASNSYGATLSKAAKVSVTLPLVSSMDASNYTWTTTGAGAWFGQTNTTHDGVDAAQSGSIGNGQETILQTTVSTNRAGRYTFWWKVSSEPVFDTLEFRINGVTQTNISGQVDWQQVSIFVPAGTNVLQWRYSKDASNSGGADAAWVDQFAFVPAPFFLQQPGPANLTVTAGATVGYNASISAYYETYYQWWQNGAPITGNLFNSSLILTNVGRAQNGTYFLVASNVGGVTTSSNVNLKVLVPQLLSGPVLLPDGSLQINATDANGAPLISATLSNFTAQASSNLIDWITLPGALALTNGGVQLQDPGASNSPMQFYRIIESQ